jgi:hypothetical protein
MTPDQEMRIAATINAQDFDLSKEIGDLPYFVGVKERHGDAVPSAEQEIDELRAALSKPLRTIIFARDVLPSYTPRKQWNERVWIPLAVLALAAGLIIPRACETSTPPTHTEYPND